MKNILYEGYLGPRLPREVQLKRVQRVMQEELTPLQRETLIAFYFQEQTLTQIAADRGVNKSTVCRTLKRAEAKLRRYLKPPEPYCAGQCGSGFCVRTGYAAENPAKIDSPAGRIPGRAAVSPFYRRGRPGRAGRAWGSRSSLTFGDFGDRL